MRKIMFNEKRYFQTQNQLGSLKFTFKPKYSIKAKIM